MTIPRRPLAFAALGLLALVPAACGDDQGGGEATVDTTTTTGRQPTDVSLVAEMSGKAEVPGPGVTDGTGLAEVRVTGGELCYKLNATMGETPTNAHIHQGDATAAGGVVVDLKPTFTKGESAFIAESCITPDAAALVQVAGNPAGHYVNIHTAEHPNGAMRGQLGKAGN